MNKSKLSFRCRPGLGTLIRVQVDKADLIEPIYTRIAQIEKIFNFHNPESELSQLNQLNLMPRSQEFKNLMQIAAKLRLETEGAFTPYVEEQKGMRFESVAELKVDLSGIAKGFAVDQAVERALEIDPEANGFIEAGGDIRYFGNCDFAVKLRLGIPPEVKMRDLKLTAPRLAVASSSVGMASHYGLSRTTLRKSRWKNGTTITAVAPECTIADALTKVILFGGFERVPELEAEIFVFDSHGELIQGEQR